jgi:RNA polymerase sigma-70 factor (ECF subfamily)
MENPEVIRAAQAGDAQAFAALYSAFKTKVYQRCLFMVRNKEDAEDLTQEVFLRLHNKIGQYDFRSKFATWLYTVTMTTAINWINRKKEDPESIEERDF